MKKILLLICICTVLACKKGGKDDLINQSFVLRAATVSPAMMINNKAETNYMTMSGASACLNHDYTITFKKDGTYAISSKGPLCDMVANMGTQKWTKEGDKVTLTHPYGAAIVASLKDGKLIYSSSLPSGGVTYEIVYQFEAK
ncbi:MAG TPA: hypothetical protein VL088_14210 [Pedobacter sp.]|nr:hypothetical protein [Pedobacter sp.]